MKEFKKEKLEGIPELYETDGNPDKKAYLHFYNLSGQGDWYVCEKRETEDDVIFYGYVELLYNEWGYFSLNELKTVPTRVYDTGFKPKPIKEIIKEKDN